MGGEENLSPETDTWSPVTNGIVNGWNAKLLWISLNGQFYALEYWNKTVFNISDKKITFAAVQVTRAFYAFFILRCYKNE
jgi:hypothetical protein